MAAELWSGTPDIDVAEVQDGEQDRSLVTVCGVSINISINISIWYQYQHLVSVSAFGISISTGPGALSEVLVNLDSPTLVRQPKRLATRQLPLPVE